MKWTNFFDGIFVLNLDKRQDRLLQITEDFEKYEIPFERVPAIEHSNGAEGLKLTMIKLFNDCLENGYKDIIVFEDDCLFVVPEVTVHDTMNKVVDQLPERYIMIFMGCQPTGGFSHFVSPNILSGQKLFSTQGVIYSERGMKEILASQLEGPIDNHYVAKIEPIGGSYCVYPLLASQREGYSDIYKNQINWRPFIEAKYEQELNRMRSR